VNCVELEHTAAAEHPNIRTSFVVVGIPTRQPPAIFLKSVSLLSVSRVRQNHSTSSYRRPPVPVQQLPRRWWGCFLLPFPASGPLVARLDAVRGGGGGSGLTRAAMVRLAAESSRAGWCRQLLAPVVATIALGSCGAAATSTAPRPLPTAQQAVYMEAGFSMFVHFGLNTFTPKTEHNPGTIPATIFAPDRLDTDQWARTAKAMGAYAMCLTAKHEGGFALWPTAHSNYSVAHSQVPHLDVVALFVRSCRKFGLQPCFYESPVENGFSMQHKPPPSTAEFV
jgi:hypothetical protein